MATKIFVLLALFCGIICEARHIHPRKDGENLYKLDEAVKDEPINILHTLKPTRFVPLNSPQFFKFHEPCKDGFTRDAMGICREVWD